MTITKTCSCGGITELDLNKDGFENWKRGALIQRALPELNNFEREALLSGMCFDCQSKLFNRPKPGESWGKHLGECNCCGADIWEKDRFSDTAVKCKICGELNFIE